MKIQKRPSKISPAGQIDYLFFDMDWSAVNRLSKS